MTKKFRVWSKERKKFIKDDYLAIGLDGGLIWRRICYSLDEDDFWDDSWVEEMDKDEYVIQQWTGLTDSQGVEIYEGDIVDNLCRVDCAKFGDKIIEGCIPSHFSIEKSVFKEVKCVKDATFNTVNIIGYYKLKTTVIGNIFQNPELLEKC